MYILAAGTGEIAVGIPRAQEQAGRLKPSS